VRVRDERRLVGGRGMANSSTDPTICYSKYYHPSSLEVIHEISNFLISSYSAKRCKRKWRCLESTAGGVGYLNQSSLVFRVVFHVKLSIAIFKKMSLTYIHAF
jgi:hypothetical protein